MEKEHSMEMEGTNLRISENAAEDKTASAKQKEENQFNLYATKKTIAQGLLDIALLTNSISQLKYIILTGPGHQFYSLLICVISSSLVLQVLAGVLLLLIGSKTKLKAQADKYNNIVTVIIFIITVLNVMATSFLDTVTTRELYCKSIRNSTSAQRDTFLQMLNG